MQHLPPVERDDFTIAIICALPVESDAVEAAFDSFFEDDDLPFTQRDGDPNLYTLGKIGRHYVVLVHMFGMGKVNSASVSANMFASFPGIRLGLVVGICGAVPQSDNKDIFLGDIIISTGVVQSDFGRQYTGQFIRKNNREDNLGRPNQQIRSFMNGIMGQRRQRKLRDALLQNITDICDKEGFADRTRPMLENDRPYRANYGHMHRVLKDCSVCAHVAEGGPVVCERALTMSCEQLGCDEDQTMSRERKANDTPAIHFGGFSSSDQVMKSAQDRDRIAKQEDILGFEMESAGVWDNFPTVVIKGVCDYADSHKNKKWRQYASVTAAAGAKAFLQQWMMTNQNNTRATGGAGFETAAGNGIGQQRALLENNGNVGIQGLYQAFHGHVTMR